MLKYPKSSSIVGKATIPSTTCLFCCHGISPENPQDSHDPETIINIVKALQDLRQRNNQYLRLLSLFALHVVVWGLIKCDILIY